MSPNDDLEQVLRRAADHLTRRGAEYRERPVAEVAPVEVRSTRTTRTGLRIAGVTAVAASVLAVSVALISADTPSARLEPRSSTDVAGDVTDPTDADGGSTGDTARPGDSTVLPPVVSDPSFPAVPDPTTGDDAGVTDPRVPPTSGPGIFPPPPDIDGSRPVISAVQVPPSVAAGSTATFRWRVVDPDGVSSTGITVGWASGIFTQCGFGQSARLESGTLSDGVWVYSCRIPENAVSTTYSVTVDAQDAFANWSSASGPDFVITGGSADSSPPTLESVEVVGVARVGQVLTVRWTLTDTSGIAGAVMWVAGPSGGFTDLTTGLRYALYDTMEITRQCSGDTCEYTQTVQLSPDAPAGTYALWSSATDTLGNKTLESVRSFTVLG